MFFWILNGTRPRLIKVAGIAASSFEYGRLLCIRNVAASGSLPIRPLNKYVHCSRLTDGRWDRVVRAPPELDRIQKNNWLTDVVYRGNSGSNCTWVNIGRSPAYLSHIYVRLVHVYCLFRFIYRLILLTLFPSCTRLLPGRNPPRIAGSRWEEKVDGATIKILLGQCCASRGQRKFSKKLCNKRVGIQWKVTVIYVDVVAVRILKKYESGRGKKTHLGCFKSDKVFSKFIKLQKGILTESLSSGNKILTN